MTMNSTVSQSEDVGGRTAEETTELLTRQVRVFRYSR